MSDTPRIDADKACEYIDKLAEHCLLNPTAYKEDAKRCVLTLERENAAMRQAIKEAHEHLCNVGSGRGCLQGFDLDDAMPDIEAAANKLQPFNAP